MPSRYLIVESMGTSLQQILSQFRLVSTIHLNGCNLKQLLEDEMGGLLSSNFTRWLEGILATRDESLATYLKHCIFCGSCKALEHVVAQQLRSFTVRVASGMLHSNLSI